MYTQLYPTKEPLKSNSSRYSTETLISRPIIAVKNKGYNAFSQVQGQKTSGPSDELQINGVKSSFDYQEDIRNFVREAQGQIAATQSVKDTLDMFVGLQGQLQVTQIKQPIELKQKSMDQLKGLSVTKDRLQKASKKNLQTDDMVGRYSSNSNQIINLKEIAQKGVDQNFNFVRSDRADSLEGVPSKVNTMNDANNRANPWNYQQNVAVLQSPSSRTEFPMIIQSSHPNQSETYSPQPKPQNNSNQSKPRIRKQKKMNYDVKEVNYDFSTIEYPKQQKLNSTNDLLRNSAERPDNKIFSSQAHNIVKSPTFIIVTQRQKGQDDEFDYEQSHRNSIQKQSEKMKDLIHIQEMSIGTIQVKHSKSKSTEQKEFKEIKIMKSQEKLTRIETKKPISNGIYFTDSKFPKEPDFQKKYADFRHTLNLLNLGNFLFVRVSQLNGGQIYKAYISKGNNGLLVRNLVKQRWWWGFVDSSEKDQSNFVWTQLRHNQYVSQLKPKQSYAYELKCQLEPHLEDASFQTADTIRSHHQNQNKQLGLLSENLIQVLPERSLQTKSGKSMNTLKFLNEQQLKRLQFGNLMSVNKEPQLQKIHNHFENNYHLGNKKALFYNMRSYYNTLGKDVFDYLPLTFHVKKGLECEEYLKFKDVFINRNNFTQSSQNIWIVKPGECTNRGHGINVCSSLNEINTIIGSKDLHKNGSLKTYIIQKYIERPLLYQRRKFDIRCYLLLATINGLHKAYWYQEGYIRTSSKEFSTKNLQNKMVHLTNDAVQKNGDDYGRYEKGNKVSFEEFSKFIDETSKITFANDIYPKIKQLAVDQVFAVYGRIDPQRRLNGFEIFGLDFMIDEAYHVWLIECNTNPCLEVCCPLLARLIPSMLENVFRLVLDPLFPPPPIYNIRKIPSELTIQSNKFELIFDELDVVNKESAIQTKIDNVDLIEEESEEDDEKD